MKRFPPFPSQINEAILLVQSYRDGNMQGKMIHPRLDAPREFQSIPQMILLLDELSEQEARIVCCQAFEPTGHESTPRIATLRIQILFRENYSWQGCILWEDQRKEATFRSVLELIQLLDEILAE